MAPIAAKLTTEEMQKLNARVDIDGVLPDKVAREWLKDVGFTDGARGGAHRWARRTARAGRGGRPWPTTLDGRCP
jgi:hypothetical protein